MPVGAIGGTADAVLKGESLVGFSDMNTSCMHSTYNATMSGELASRSGIEADCSSFRHAQS